ncbi:FAD-dependent oxidoreductase [Candidatus Woesearchaeota archaeon]|nr:FAD-dependent oxidoreductase [Candidatus Woesearchaeota archaeon]
MVHDLIIIGAGPAGMSAAVYAARNKLDFLIISKDIGGQAVWSSDVENYIGYQFITGAELTQKFEEHVKKYNVQIITDEIVELRKPNSIFEVEAKSSKKYQAKTVIIASGKKPRMLNVPGEKEFRGKGVTYCAVCDAPLFSGKDVAVIGGGNSALDAALQLTKYANKIYMINITGELGGEEVLRQKIEKNKKVAVLNNSKTVEIFGDKFVKGIKLEQDKMSEIFHQFKTGGRKPINFRLRKISEHAQEPPDAMNSNNIPPISDVVLDKIKIIAVQGVFIEIGLVPETDFANIAKKNEFGEIIIDQSAKTNIPGIFAAGDVTNTPEKQIVVAAGEGAKAALGAIRYLSSLK